MYSVMDPKKSVDAIQRLEWEEEEMRRMLKTDQKEV